jgi:arginine-tRNA-protein transferase
MLGRDAQATLLRLPYNPAVPDTCPWPSHPPPVSLPLTVLPDRPCPYLPGRTETIRGFLCDGMAGELYHAFMDRAFRRSGRFFYQPVCRGCRECQPIRVPTATLRASKSQRRVWRRNQDLAVTVTPRPCPTKEKFELYLRYQRARHNPDRPEDAAGFAEFLYQSSVDSVEFTYRDAGGKLIGVGIGDVCAKSLSSVYFDFDPAAGRRSLGVFSAMWEIAFAARENIPHYYLGYWVRDCATMRYKSDFRPFELLGADGVWRAGGAATEAAAYAVAAEENCPARVVEMP